MQFWGQRSAAERYSVSRPYFHPVVIGLIRERFGKDFARVLDVACGTGLSTVALLEISNEVYGTDISSEMLAVASRRDGITYVEAPAEELPFRDECFDLLTVSSGLHWFDRERFFAEAAKVLLHEGHLIVYDNWFTGRMSGNPEYEKWLRGIYSRGCPSPPRNREPLSEKALSRYGLVFSGRESFKNEVRYSVEELSEYLMTQSNFIAATQNGSISEGELKKRLIGEQTPLFRSAGETFEFGGEISYSRKT